MNIKKTEPFAIVGIAVRTTNEDGQSSRDIPELWKRFMDEDIRSMVPGRVDDTIYAVYTDYEKDYTRPYTALLGYRVLDLHHIPNGLTGRALGGGDYVTYTVSGNFNDNIILDKWVEIWNNEDMKRSYTADFEVYVPEEIRDYENARVEIFVAVDSW